MNLTASASTPTTTADDTAVAVFDVSPAPGDVDEPRVDGTVDVSPAPADAPEPRLDETEEECGTSYARCSDGHGTLSHLFFSDDDLDIARAKAICGACGLRDGCLAGALERGEPFGVWGGKLLVDGVPVDFKRRRGRPPKHPRPVLVVDEVPVPPHLVA